MPENNQIQFEDLDQVLRSAQLRRSADLGLWLRQYIESRRQARLQEAVNLPQPATAPQGAVV
jgi:hypothetical protein